ncbi:calponin homology domain-containing protein DDB_G0272472 [Condylostylus longicornis]|uniref:calponin homology domain-containing protein DDB_G0272472 n=1 Tax=Condylostylus longicornis TaxID=2530218 RepID=UPI00244DF35E|nr:calponin homology domain-containing protein DDB_G0272472 [Condylostylus longicornis]
MVECNRRKMLKGSQNIKKRLEELHQWQKEQQRNIEDDHQHVTELYQNENEIPSNYKVRENCNYLDEPPKRRYLKRGEGLKSRFKIDPDSLRLHNLPKYKFSKAHKNNLKLNVISQNQAKHEVNKKNFNRDKNPNKLNLKQSLNEKNDYSDEADSICESFSAGQEFKYVDLSNATENINMGENTKIKKIKCESEEFPLTWAKVINSYQANSFSKENFPDSSLRMLERKFDDTEDTNILRVINKTTNKRNFNLNNSSMENWLQEKAIALFESFKDSSEIKQIRKDEKSTNYPFPSDNDDQFLTEFVEAGSESRTSDFSENDSSTDDEHSNLNIKSDMQGNQSDKCHVRFSENVKVNQAKNDIEISREIPFCNEKMTNTDFYNKSEDYSEFEKFKKNLFDTTLSINENTSDDTTLIGHFLEVPLKNNIEENRKDIIAKTELLKKRLFELEIEISTFRKNNSELLKLKQEHELNRIQLEQERLEMQEKFNDEKIKYEIHLHDERLNIEEERRKLEKCMREQKIPNKKERNEILKLREEVENLQKELRNKDSIHVAAQGRLRAQIRNFEKEVKLLTLEIENLKKENKKLESENARMIRQNNNKILQEINKTIAKLAVKPIECPVETTNVNKHSKPVYNEISSQKQKPPYMNYAQKLSTPEIQSFEKNNENLGKNCDEKNNSCSSLIDEENILTAKKTIRFINDNFPMSSKIVENRNENDFDNNKFKREIEHSDGSKDIWYPNGNLKKISSDGMNIKMLYFNKDIKETNISEGTVRYYYADKNTWHTTYLDGLEILEFPNGQTEHRHKNGTIEVHFPNGSIRISNSSDSNKLEEWRYADGTSSVLFRNGDKILSFPNGQKEIHTKIHKRREYPDGTVKIVYPDGSQETRYSNGRIRLKDNDGNLIMDSLNNF